ncbi:MAG: hypothetical protein K6G24_03870, partial [Lachnospiraceae bacterium]|nr:hypothetical protein [Lachnospiraceae bacterium]
MKNPGAKRFLSWLMSVVMVVGEFGGMPLVTSAQEDTQEEVIEEVLEDEAAEEEVALGASEEEEVVVAEDDIVVEEDAQNDPVQIDVRPQKDVENGVYTWAPLAQIADYDDGWSSDDGKFYLNNTGYGIGVSTNATSAPEDILWISGTALYRTGEKDNYSAEGCVSINKLITEMVACKVTGDIDFQNGNYYVYVGCGDPYSKASNAPFEFSYSEDGTAPVAGWHEYRDNFVRFDNAENRWFWWDEDYRKENNIPDDEPIPDYPEVCPDGYFSKNNYKLVMKDSENAGAIGYIVRAMNGGKILDRNIGEGEEQIFAIYEEEREGNSTCTYTLIDDFAGFEIAAIRGNGQISGFVSPVKMAPWEAEEFRTWDAVLNVATKYHFGYDFEAPEFSHNHGTWTDDRGTETVADDIEHVDKFGYNVYVNKPDASRDESRWVELWIENETVRKVTGEGENAVITDTSTINTYAVLIEMNKKYLEDTAAGIQSFEEGVYDVWIVTGDDSGSYYNTNSFQVNFEYPDDNTPGKEVTYNWHPVWIKDTENGIEEYERQKIDNEDGTYRDEDDEEIYAKMATEEYKDYREMKMVDLSTVFYTTSYTPTGFIIKTLNGKKIQNWNGSTTDTFAVPLYYRNSENPEMNCSFMVPADFRINKDATITYITKGSKGTCNAVAGHWYDDIEVEDFVNNYLGKFILTPFAGSVSMVPDNKDNPDGPKHAEYTEKYWYDMRISYRDDPDGLQDINWYNYLIRLKSETEIEVDIAEIITQIVRDRIEADITAGERGNSDLLAGRYEVVFIAGDQNGPYARSFPQLIDLTKLAEIADMDTPQALYRNGEDWFRLIKDGDDWHWQSIKDYYYDPERVEYQIKEDENHIIEWWDLTDAQRMSYIHSANASLEENEQFIQKNTMDISLASSGEYAIGYIVRLINNRFVYNAEDGSVVESRMRGDEADPGRNMETHMGGIIEAPIEDGKLMVAAIYADGSVSDWYYGRERQDWDEWPQIEMHLTNNAGVISWDQEYKRDEFDNILYWDNEHTNPQLDGGVDIYVADPEGIWYRVDAYYDWDTEHNKASIKLADVLTNMTYMKLRGYAAFKSGTYTLYVVKHTNNGDRASESDIEFNFKPTADKNANFSAVYKEHQKWIKAVPDDDHFNFDEKDVNTDGYTATIQYETLIKTASDNIAGYVVNMPNGIMDANENEAVYYSWFPYNHQAEGFYTARTWEYSAAPGEVKIAAIYTDGTMSEWVTAEPWSKADDYEAVDMGITYDNVTARFAVNPEKLAALKDKLDDYSDAGAQAEGDGYTPIANAAIVIRGVENYDIGSRVLKKGENLFRADDQFLPVRAAIDELMFKAGQKNTWDDDQGHHEEPWKYLAPGTYKAAFVIRDQWNGNVQTASGMASDQEISFTYKKGEAVTTPARGSATYSYEDRGNGRDYRVHVSSASDEAVAYIVRFKVGNIYRYEEGITNESGDFGFFMGGEFAENYDAELAVCAVNMYGDISEF